MRKIYNNQYAKTSIPWTATRRYQSIISVCFLASIIVLSTITYSLGAKSRSHNTTSKEPVIAQKDQQVLESLDISQMQPLVYEDTAAGPQPKMCGPRALQIVCLKLGINADAERIADLAGTDSTGTSMYGLKTAAERLGLFARGLQANLSYLKKTHNPTIVWIGRDHYVVVLNISDKVVGLNDPNSGEMQVTISEFANAWDGYLLELSKEKH